MARIRSIKPEFPQSETVGKLSRDARLLFIQLWTLVDDEGRARASSRMLASLLYPYDDDAPSLIGGWLDELEERGAIRRYEVDGTTYLEVVKWLKHQKIDKPSGSKLPPFGEGSRIVAKPREDSAPDLGSRILDQGSVASATGGEPPSSYPIDPGERLWAEGMDLMLAMTVGDREARSAIGRWRKETKHDDARILGAIVRARELGSKDPISLVSRILRPIEKSNGNVQNPKSVHAAADRLVERVAGFEAERSIFDQERDRIRASANPARLISQGRG